MSPEYALDGIFSIKSDIYSFGVLLLEIISGKRNKGFYYSGRDYNLLECVSLKPLNLIVLHTQYLTISLRKD